MTGIAQFIKERDAALLTIDLDWARRAMPWASCDEVRILAMHKARLAPVTMPPELRHASAAFLRAASCAQYDGSLLPPEGQLP